MTGSIVYDLHNMLVVGSLLHCALLMTFYFSYVKAKTRPTYLYKKYNEGQIFLMIWSVLLLFEWISPKAWMAILFSYLKEGVICSLSFFVLFLIADYYIRNAFLKRVVFLIAWIPSSFFLLYILMVSIGINSMLNNLIHGISVVLNLLYLVIGLIYVITKSFENKSINKIKKFHFVITIVVFPIYVYAIYCGDFLQLRIDLLIYFLPFYLIVIIVMTIKYQIFDDLPTALQAVFENVHYGIIVISNSLEILSLNTAFFRQSIPIVEVNNFIRFLEQLKQVTSNKLSVDNILTSVKEVEQNQITGEIKVDFHSKTTDFTYTINSIYDDYDQKIATMVTFRDITQIKSLQYNIEQKNVQLLEANNKLKEHMENLRALTVEKERNALMTEINDTFGHSMTEILGLLEVCSMLMDQEEEQEERVEKTISDTIARARKALDEMRQSVSKYKRGATLDD